MSESQAQEYTASRDSNREELTADEVYDRHQDVLEEWAGENSAVGEVARAIIAVATDGGDGGG